MVKLVRVDERLVHGQVAFAWTNSLAADRKSVGRERVC